jgi:hypothetical protein
MQEPPVGGHPGLGGSFGGNTDCGSKESTFGRMAGKSEVDFTCRTLGELACASEEKSACRPD